MTAQAKSLEANQGGGALEMEEAPTWSLLAIATFVISLTSPLAVLIGFIYWPIVILTIVASVASIVVAVKGGRYVRGGWLGCAALVLSLFFLTLAIARNGADRKYMSDQAVAAADRWLALIQDGKLDEAHQMTLGSEYRESPEVPIKEFYRLNAQARSSRDTFFLQPPIKFLANDPKNCRWKYLENVGRSVDEKAEVVRVRFSIRYLDGTTPRETEFSLEVARYRNPKFEEHRWVVRGIANVETR